MKDEVESQQIRSTTVSVGDVDILRLVQSVAVEFFFSNVFFTRDCIMVQPPRHLLSPMHFKKSVGFQCGCFELSQKGIMMPYIMRTGMLMLVV